MLYLPLLIAFVPADLDGLPLPVPEPIRGRYVNGTLLLVVEKKVTRYETRAVTEIVVDANGGQRAVTRTVQVPVETVSLQEIALQRFQIVRADGRPVPAEQLAKLLAEVTPMVKAPRYDRSLEKNLKPGTLILIDTPNKER